MEILLLSVDILIIIIEVQLGYFPVVEVSGHFKVNWWVQVPFYLLYRALL
jgi:hypothetical protein